MSNLTNLQVKAMKLPGRYSDGNGLYLRIAPGGSKQWVQRIVVDDKRRDLGIGGYPAVTLAQARNLVKENRARVASGKAALGARERKAKAKPKTKTRPTFREMAEECRAELARILWTSERTGKIFQRRCNMYLYPEFGDWPIDKITQADIKRVCVAIAETTPQTARRVRIVAHQVFEYAKDERKLRDNPASKSLDKYLITKNTPPPENRKALPYAEVRGALDKVMVSPSDLTTKACYLFMVATAVRQGEARKAIWDEIDLSDPDNPKWTIHYTRMKMRHEHIVPLSNQAVAVLKLVRPLSGGSGYVFPSEYSKYGHLSDSTLGVVNAANGIDCNVHGFRSSFRDWAEETTRYSRLAMELSLAHSVGDSTEQSYRRTTVVEQRQKLMQEWADFALGNCVDVLDQQGANATIFNASLA